MVFYTEKLVNPPIFTKEDFLSIEHWIRYKTFLREYEKERPDLKAIHRVVDTRYIYYIYTVPEGQMIVGTDDIQKMFVRFVNTNDVLPYQLDFRVVNFGFHYHWWETDEIWSKLTKKSTLRVRLQGDVIMEMWLASKETVRDYAKEPEMVKMGFVRHYGILPDEIVRMDFSLRKWRTVVKFGRREYKRLLKINNNYELELGIGKRKHHVQLTGFRINRRVYLVNKGTITLTHPEHGKNEFYVKKPIMAVFTVS